MPIKENIWSNVKEISRVNASNHQNYEDVLIMGPRSLAILRYELEQKDTNNQHPSESMVYKQSRKRDPTPAFKTDGRKTKENIENLDAMQLEIKKLREKEVTM